MENYFGNFGTETEAKALLLPLIDQLLTAQVQGDYETFCNLFADSFRENNDEASFHHNHQGLLMNLGQLKSQEFLASLNRDGQPSVLIVATFEKTENHVLITVVFNNDKENPKIDGLWFN